MRGAWRVADIRTAEEQLMTTLPEGVLMQRAATGLARRCLELLGERGGAYGSRVLLLVGAGNNGGDALYAGAVLAGRGAAVRALLLRPDRTHPEGLAALRQAGGSTVTAVPSTVDLVVDGIVGIGSQGGLRGAAAEMVETARSAAGRDGKAPVTVAVDVPSGVDVDTGAVDGVAVRADVTVTFGQLKPALVVAPAARYAGRVHLVDIGLPGISAPPAVWVPEASDIAAWWPRPDDSSNKYTRGVAGLATGSGGYPGAALLSAAGALAGPAGMVRYAGAAAAEVVSHHPSVVAAPKAAQAGQVQAWLCGSGLGTDERAKGELRAVLGSAVPVVLDADALTMLTDQPLRDWLRRRQAPTVVTPHDGEFARVAGQTVGPDRVQAARELSGRLGITVLLKGDRTVVANPDGDAWVNPTGTPVLASAGTGDVLAGLLVSLLAAGLSPERAAVAAAFTHGLAGQRAAQRAAPRRRSTLYPGDLTSDHPTSPLIDEREDGWAPVTAPDVATALADVIALLLS